MNTRTKDNLRFLILFPAAFTAASFLFSLLSWGRVPHVGGTAWTPASALIELGEHAAFGAVVALPTRRPVPILVATLCAMSLDVDHFGSMIGLPMDGRASHVALFAVLVTVVVFLLARRGSLGREIPTPMAASIALATFMAHLAWDAAGGGGDFRLWMPFSTAEVLISPVGGIILEVSAVALTTAVTAATGGWHRKKRS
jgi:hypothetical protein